MLRARGRCGSSESKRDALEMVLCDMVGSIEVEGFARRGIVEKDAFDGCFPAPAWDGGTDISKDVLEVAGTHRPTCACLGAGF